MPFDSLFENRNQPAVQSVTLFVATPNGVQDKIFESLMRLGIADCSEAFAGVLAISFHTDQVQRVARVLSQALAQTDRGDTRCRVLPGGSAPNPADLMHSQPIDDFLGWVEGRWLRELLAQGRLVTYLQPIVCCDSPETLFAYECLARGIEPEGSLIAPERMFEVARAANCLTELDHIARATALATVASLQIPETIFVNINPRSILDPNNCVESALETVLELGLDPHQFVFEVVESDRLGQGDHLEYVLEAYREAGFRVALDDLGAGYSSLNVLVSVKPDFVKVDRQLIQGIETDRYKAHVAAKLLELARDLNIRSVVEGVETEAQWCWSRDHQADYAQGFYFASPGAMPVGSGARNSATPSAVEDAGHIPEPLAVKS